MTGRQARPRLVDAGHRGGGDVDAVRAAATAAAGNAAAAASAEAAAEAALAGVLRDCALDVQAGQRQRAGRRLDAVLAGDLLHLGGGEGELVARQERVAREVRARLAGGSQVEAPAAVLPAQRVALGLGQPGPGPTRTAAAGRERLSVAASAHPQRPRHRHVGADAGERLEHLLLGVVEAVGQRGDGDDEADADAQAERRQGGPAGAPAQLGADVGQVEHAELLVEGAAATLPAPRKSPFAGNEENSKNVAGVRGCRE